MPLMRKANTLHMKWCLDCHRNPEQYIRPKEQVFNMAWAPSEQEPQEVLGPRLVKEYNIAPAHRITNCSTCHR
jgi:hypothetical protein